MNLLKRIVLLSVLLCINGFVYADELELTEGYYFSTTNYNPRHLFYIYPIETGYHISERLINGTDLNSYKEISLIIIDSKSDGLYLNNSLLIFDNYYNNNGVKSTKFHIYEDAIGFKTSLVKLQDSDLQEYFQKEGIYYADQYTIESEKRIDGQIYKLEEVYSNPSYLFLSINDGYSISFPSSLNTPKSISYKNIYSNTGYEFSSFNLNGIGSGGDGPGISSNNKIAFDQEVIKFSTYFSRYDDETGNSSKYKILANFHSSDRDFDFSTISIDEKKMISTIENQQVEVNPQSNIYILDKISYNNPIRNFDFQRTKQYVFRVLIEDEIFHIHAQQLFPETFFQLPSAKVNNNRVRVRTSPSLDSDIITHVNTGDIVKVKERRNIQQIGDMIDYWFYIHLDTMEKGWIYGYFLDFE